MFKTIVVPLDRSALAEQAIGQAGLIAREAKAHIELVLVHVPYRLDPAWDASEWNAERKYLESVQGDLESGCGVSVSHALVRGDPARQICARAKEVGADLIVMTSHGRTGFSRSWLGSVADAVVRESATPVLMLRPVESEHARLAARHSFKHVLVAIDGSALAMGALPAAIDLARASGARITLLRSVFPVPLLSLYDASVPLAYAPMVIDQTATDRVSSDLQHELDSLARKLHHEHDVDISAVVEINPRPADAIVNFAAAHAVDVVAMSTHGRGASRWFVGSIADKVIRGSDLPVMLHRPVGVDEARASLDEAELEDQLPALTPTR
jgi:nucleotide-binding universal stress UspA family protein